MTAGEDGSGQVVEPPPAALAEVGLTMCLDVVTPIFDDRLGQTMGAGDPVGPTHLSDGLEALGVVDEVADVDHRSVP